MYQMSFTAALNCEFQPPPSPVVTEVLFSNSWMIWCKAAQGLLALKVENLELRNRSHCC